MLRLVQPRRIEQGNLRTLCMHDPQYSRPRRLRLVRDDRNLMLKQSIEQCRLADVRSTNDRNCAKLHGATGVAAPVTVMEPIDTRFHLCERSRAARAPAVRFSRDRVPDDRCPPEACGSSFAIPEGPHPAVGHARAWRSSAVDPCRQSPRRVVVAGTRRFQYNVRRSLYDVANRATAVPDSA